LVEFRDKVVNRVNQRTIGEEQMSKRRVTTLAAAVSVLATLSGAPASADAVSDFYEGRALTVLVVSGSGGLNALYARTVGDRIGKHIPGNPKVIYQYMPGGGGLKGANYCYTAAPKDGSVLCQVLNPLGLMQMIRPKGVKYDAGNFAYIGSTGDQNGSFAVWHTVKADKLMDLQQTEVAFAGTGKGSESYYDPAMVNALFGTKIKLVMGYKGGGQLDLAMERQETVGRAGPLISWIVRKPQWLSEGKIRLLAQVGLKKEKGYEQVPLLTEFARNDDERAMLKLISSRSAIGRPIAAPPGVPADRIAALRKAFVDTMNDPEFQADVKKRRLLNAWRTGEEVQQVMADMLATPKNLIDRTRETLGFPK
jgi:tripartite-type tricarboxylate transporter receptor subunit TctC